MDSPPRRRSIRRPLRTEADPDSRLKGRRLAPGAERHGAGGALEGQQVLRVEAWNPKHP